MNMRNVMLVAGLVIVLGIGGYFIFTQEPAPPEVPSDCADFTEQDTTITYTEAKVFDPFCVKVSSGASVTWQNESGSALEVGADPHPVHTGNREVSNDEFVLELADGESSTVTVTTVGAFGYHDHLNSSATGIIVVE